MSSHLTPAEKLRHVSKWLEQRVRPLPDGDLAGKGWPDPDVFELTDRLNAIEGVCTLQSCSGHPQQEVEPEIWCVSVAHLWLWLSEDLFTKFVKRADQLIVDPNIEQVGILWGSNGTRPVATITFHGLDQGEEIFQCTSDVIVAFFEGLQQ